MSFIIEWIIFYVAILAALSFDNYNWIPADYKWYGTKEWKPHFKPLFIIGKRELFLIPQNKEGWKIIWSRVKDVNIHIYDIIPGIISSFILALIL